MTKKANRTFERAAILTHQQSRSQTKYDKNNASPTLKQISSYTSDQSITSIKHPS